MSEPNKHLWDQVALGIEAESFMGSPLGKYIRQQSVEDIDEAFDAFVEIDPADTAAIKALQFKAQVGRRLLSIFEDLKSAGQQAVQTLHDMDASD